MDYRSTCWSMTALKNIYAKKSVCSLDLNRAQFFTIFMFFGHCYRKNSTNKKQIAQINSLELYYATKKRDVFTNILFSK